MSQSADRDLLFGILAFQNNFITREQLLSGVQRWLDLEKKTPIDEILIEQEAITTDKRDILTPLISIHIQQHDDDPAKSMAAISSVGSIKGELLKLGDDDVDKSMAAIGGNFPTQDPFLTAQSVGESTSKGTRFTKLRDHAEGGLGKVSVANDTELSREVALKEIQLQYADEPNSRDRFLLEAEVTGGLEHPNIVPVYGLGRYADGRPFYAMRFIKGDSLQEAIDEFFQNKKEMSFGDSQLELRKLLGRFVDVCNAVEYAHSRRVLHRDLKPGNIMLGKYGETLVVDWGLAKVLGQPEITSTNDIHEPALQPTSGSSIENTIKGSAIGTPRYMSPEQAIGNLDALGPETDVYSLGATLYCLLTGHAPFMDRDKMLVLKKVQKGDFPNPREVDPSIPKSLEAVCLKAMANQPKDRYASPFEISQEIENWLADEPVEAYQEPLTARLKRWGRRHQTAIGTVGALMLVSILALCIGIWVVNDLREQNATLANNEKLEKERARKNLYAATIKLAYRKVLEGSILEAKSLLKSCKPYPGEIDLRGWEWEFLNNKANWKSTNIDTGQLPIVEFDIATKKDRLAVLSEAAISILDLPADNPAIEIPNPQGMFYHVAISPEGSHIALCGLDNNILIRNLKSPDKNEHAFEANMSKTVKIGFSNDDHNLLVCIGEDGLAKVFDIPNKSVIDKKLTISQIEYSAISKFENYFVTYQNGVAQVWEYSRNEVKELFAINSRNIHRLSFSAWNRELYGIEKNGNLLCWGMEDGELKFEKALSSEYGKLTDIYCPVNPFEIYISCEDSLLIWDTYNKKVSHSFYTPNRTRSVVADSDNKYLITTNETHKISLYGDSIEELSELHNPFDNPEVGSGIAVNRSGKNIAVLNALKGLSVWDSNTKRELLRKPYPVIDEAGWVSAITWGSDKIISIDQHGLYLEWNAQNGNIERRERIPDSRFGEAVFNKEATLLSAFNTQKDSIELFETQTLKLEWSSEDFAPEAFDKSFNSITRHTITNDSNYILASSNDGFIYCFDWKKNELKYKAPSGKFILNIKAEDSVFAVTGWDGNVYLHDIDSGKLLREFKGGPESNYALKLSPEKNRIVAGGGQGRIKIWDLETGNLILSAREHNGFINFLEFINNGKDLVTHSNDGEMRFWEGGVAR
jgi:serine/threonine protein kinase/WD40 repeat protein